METNPDKITVNGPMVIGQLFQKISYNQETLSSLKNDTWADIELTEEEIEKALDNARCLKFELNKDRIREERKKKFKEAMQRPWTPQEMYGYILDHRTIKTGFSENNGIDGKAVFMVDDSNADILKALCYYFTNNPDFEKLCSPDASGTGVIHHNWKLNKGLLVCGVVGCGKTIIMKLFAINKRQCYDVMNSLNLTKIFAKKGDEAVERFGTVHRYEPMGPDNFYQEKCGLCLDDVGTEEEKQYFGNKANVIAEILFERYANRLSLPFHMTHMTTNLNATGMEKMYGPRVWSRIMEMFNVIQLNGNDRRKY